MPLLIRVELFFTRYIKRLPPRGSAGCYESLFACRPQVGGNFIRQSN